MKNLSKVLAVVLAFAMALSMVSFAAYTDIEAGDNCEEAVTVLSALGILSGYQDGTFKPEATITRAEFASVVIRMLGYGDIASGGSVVFTDVPADHWANGVIGLAAAQGIISGYGDGRFGPEDPVNYEQAIAMVVRALGYTPMADANGGYPGGHQVVASSKGILTGTTGAPGLPANRGTVAQFVYNSLTVPMMEQVTYGTETTYKPVKKLVLNIHNVAKFEGTVDDTPNSDPKLEAGKVKVLYTAQVSAPENNAALAVKYYDDKTDYYAYPQVKHVGDGSAVTLKASAEVEAAAKEIMDMGAIMFVKNADSAKSAELLCVLEDDDKNTIVEFASEDIAKKVVVDDDYKPGAEDKDGNALNNPNKDEIVVYTDKESGETEKYEVALTKIYVNDREVEGARYTTLLTYAQKGNTNVDVKLLANGTDEDLFTVAYITDWDDAVVESVSEKSWRVYLKDAATLELDETDEDKKFVIYKDGEVASFADIKANDVLSYYGDLGVDEDEPYGVVHIVSDKVEGKVTGTATNAIFVDGVEYKALTKVKEEVESKMGNSYVFYKNARGVIIGEDKAESKGNVKYGFASYFYNNGDTEQSSVRLLTSDGVWTTIECPAKFAINGNSVNEAKADWINNAGFTTTATGSQTRYTVNQVVGYELTANGEISKLYTVTNKDIFEISTKNASANSSTKDQEFKAAAGKLGSFAVNDSTIIFSIKDGANLSQPVETNDVSVVAVSTLIDRDDYNVMKAYNMDDESGIYAALCGHDIVSDINWASDFFMVSADPIQTTNEAGDKGYFLTGIQGGETKTFFINTDAVNGIDDGTYDEGTDTWTDLGDVLAVTDFEDKTTDNKATTDLTLGRLEVKNIKKGDVLLYGVNGAGEAAKVVRLISAKAQYGSSEGTFGMLLDNYSNAGSPVLASFEIGSTKYQFVIGYAVARKDSKIFVINNGDSYDEKNDDVDDASEFRFAADVIGAAFDSQIGDTGRVTEAAYGDINLDRTFGFSSGALKDGDLVFARVIDEVTVEDFAVVRNYRKGN